MPLVALAAARSDATMGNRERQVATPADLTAAVGDAAINDIVVTANLTGLRTIRLSPGARLRGAKSTVTVRFAAGQDGVQLSSDNRLENLELMADMDRRAIFNDTQVESLGRLVLRNLRTTGVIQILARDRVRAGFVEANHVDTLAGDTRGYDDRPKGYGVEVVPGAFTLWNQQADRSITIAADLAGLTAGRPDAPVRGSGVFVSGAGAGGGRLLVRRLETGAIYTDAGIAQGTSDRIAAGVFVVSGAFVDRVVDLGPVTTYGPNDMILDNWGTVGHWTANGKLVSHGPSGIGFVNFGTIDVLDVRSAIETFGQGSRGFNVYTGTVHRALFDRIVTHADGAVGVQISQPVGELTVRRGIETFGGTGDSLVKGAVVKLAAVPLSIKPGGSARKITIAGGLVSHGAGIDPLELHGEVDALQITGPVRAAGGGFGGAR
jgi:hypothetical protein